MADERIYREDEVSFWLLIAYDVLVSYLWKNERILLCADKMRLWWAGAGEPRGRWAGVEQTFAQQLLI